jgi:hyperosmotically inducible periplasmic protein
MQKPSFFRQFTRLTYATILVLGVSACDKPNSAEEAGREIDQAAATAGEKVDRAEDKLREKSEEVVALLSTMPASRRK